MKSPSLALKEESAAFYWFNSRIIADAGNSMYGRFVYERFLPSLVPPKGNDQKTWFVLFDGDCMADSEGLRDYFRQQDNVLLGEAKRIRENLCYVIAVLGQGNRTWDEIDQELRQERVLGYMGMTVPVRFNRETFLRCRETMALVVAVRIDGPKFKKISYEYHTDDELRKMGFAPYREN